MKKILWLFLILLFVPICHACKDRNFSDKFYFSSDVIDCFGATDSFNIFDYLEIGDVDIVNLKVTFSDSSIASFDNDTFRVLCKSAGTTLILASFKNDAIYFSQTELKVKTYPQVVKSAVLKKSEFSVDLQSVLEIDDVIEYAPSRVVKNCDVEISDESVVVFDADLLQFRPISEGRAEVTLCFNGKFNFEFEIKVESTAYVESIEFLNLVDNKIRLKENFSGVVEYALTPTRSNAYTFYANTHLFTVNSLGFITTYNEVGKGVLFVEYIISNGNKVVKQVEVEVAKSVEVLCAKLFSNDIDLDTSGENFVLADSVFEIVLQLENYHKDLSFDLSGDFEVSQLSNSGDVVTLSLRLKSEETGVCKLQLRDVWSHDVDEHEFLWSLNYLVREDINLALSYNETDLVCDENHRYKLYLIDCEINFEIDEESVLEPYYAFLKIHLNNQPFYDFSVSVDDDEAVDGDEERVVRINDNLVFAQCVGEVTLIVSMLGESFEIAIVVEKLFASAIVLSSEKATLYLAEGWDTCNILVSAFPAYAFLGEVAIVLEDNEILEASSFSVQKNENVIIRGKALSSSGLVATFRSGELIEQVEILVYSFVTAGSIIVDGKESATENILVEKFSGDDDFFISFELYFGEQLLEGYEIGMLLWSDSEHPCVLFNALNFATDLVIRISCVGEVSFVVTFVNNPDYQFFITVKIIDE